MPPPVRRATGPGRANLIGDHTDYNLGLALPMAIGLGVTVVFTPSADAHVRVSSAAYGDAEVPLDIAADAAALDMVVPPWARLIGAMVALARPATGGALHIDSTLPSDAGLSSSAALCVALAEVFDVTGPPSVVSVLCQQAEHRSGVPVGLMDPLICAGGHSGHALLIDFSTLGTRQVPVPPEVEVVVIDSGQRRALRDSAYAARVAECEAASATVGPLGLADEEDVGALRNPLLHRRARHVISECRRVQHCADALADSDLALVGGLLDESHRSLADDFEVSTPEIDALVGQVASLPGVFGARMTGAGFGGCVLALCRPGAVDLEDVGTRAWRVRPSDGTVASRPYRSRP